MWRPFLLLLAVVGYLGASNPTHRIVGGEIVSIDKIPYQLSLEYNKRSICGASIISEYWAVTAAHCLYGRQPNAIQLRSGSNITGQGGVLHQAVEIKMHDEFDTQIADYDVALLRVDKPFQKQDIISLAKITPEIGANSTISGWGRTYEGGFTSKELRWVHIPVVDQRECKTFYGNALTDRMFCAGFPEGGKDSCQGDSGGPLVVNRALVGIVSKGRGCARKEPGVYTNVAAVREWIAKNAGLDRE